MKNMRLAKNFLSLLLVTGMMLLTFAGVLPTRAAASADQPAVESGAGEAQPGGTTADNAAAEETPAADPSAEEAEAASGEPKYVPEITEDGHINSERLTQWVQNYLKADHWDEPQCSMSIGLWCSGSDETWLYNPDERMYGVNWSKLPVSMYFAEQLAKGELSNDPSINGITLEYALQTVLESSSGPSFSSMLVYLGGNTASNCAELVPQYAGLPEDYYTEDFYQRSYYTARIMMEVTKTLYQGGDERFPNVLKYMRESQPWDMFNRDDHIRNDLHTSQTHAASWGDGAGDYVHCTGVIYTPTPIVLTVMMKNIADLDIMGGVAHHMAVLAEALDARQKEIRLAEEEAAAAQKMAESSPAPAEEPADLASDSSPDSGAGDPEPASNPDTSAGLPSTPGASTPAPEGGEAYSPVPRILLMAGAGVLALLLAVTAVLRRRRA